MESILSLIEKCHGDYPEAITELLKRMTPLVKKYASKIHCMEHEDAMQEFYLALLESIPYLDPSKGEDKCLGYMKTAVINRYYSLCKHCLSVPETEDFENFSYVLESPPAIDDTYYDIDAYIKSLPIQSKKRQIMFKFFYAQKTDGEIAEELGVSRQYVNRIKKQAITEYFSRK